MTNLKYIIENYQRVGRDYYDKLRLLTFVLAIKYIKDESEIPLNAFKKKNLVSHND